jgi:hypothetical protein
MLESNTPSSIDFEYSHRSRNLPQGPQYFLLAPSRPIIDRRAKPNSYFLQSLHVRDDGPYLRLFVIESSFPRNRPWREEKPHLQHDRDGLYTVQQGREDYLAETDNRF